MEKVNMGDYVTDKITGFSGIVTGMASYISGCTQCLIAPKVNEKNELPDTQWFDIERLEKIGGGITLEEGKGGPSGREKAPVGRR